MLSRHKKNWHKGLLKALWAYQIIVRTPTQATPYFLMFSVEVVIPVEIQIPSLRVTIQEGLTDVDATKIRISKLETLDESRLTAQYNFELYKACIARAYNKKFKLLSFTKSELVLFTR